MSDTQTAIPVPEAPEQAFVPQADIIHDNGNYRRIRLHFSAKHDIEETIATLGPGGATLLKLNEEKKPKKFFLDEEELTKLANAWLQYLADRDAKERAEKLAFQQEIEAAIARAEALGAELTRTNSINEYPLFALSWSTDTHPLARFKDFWYDHCSNMYLSTAQERLEHIEKHYREAQEGDNSRGHVNYVFDEARWKNCALTVDAQLVRTAPGYYSLTFPEGHPYHHFWNAEELLTGGQVEYRLRYIGHSYKSQKAKTQ